MEDDELLSNREAAELFNLEFANNFNFDKLFDIVHNTSAALLSLKTAKRNALFSEFTCTQADVLTAIINCANTYST